MAIDLVNHPGLANVITHDGNFHADDIFSLVLLEKVFKNINVFRMANINSKYSLNDFSNKALIIDIGGGEFDHHQKGGNGSHPCTENSKKPIPYATFGLLWKKFGKEVCKMYTSSDEVAQKLWQAVEDNLVIGIDATDNGVYPRSPEEFSKYRLLTISNLITCCNPIDDLEKRDEYSFYGAIEFARSIFEKTINNQLSYIVEPDKIYKNLIPSTIFAEAFCEIAKVPLEEFAKDSKNKAGVHPAHKTLSEADKKLIPLSEFGKAWKLYGKDYCKYVCDTIDQAKYVWSYVRVNLVMGIDAIANKILPTCSDEYVPYNFLSLYSFIESLSHTQLYNETEENFRYQATELAKFIIDRFILKAFERIKYKDYVQNKIEEAIHPTTQRTIQNPSRHILVLDKHVHWQDWVLTPDAREIWFVISPSNKGGYIIQPVSNNRNKNGYRKGFPEKWWGLSGDKLKQITQNPEASFVHDVKGFIAGAETLEGAIALCKKAFKHYECERIR